MISTVNTYSDISVCSVCQIICSSVFADIVGKVKVVFLYSAVSVGPSKRFTLFSSPGRPVHSDTNSASPGSILARQQLCAKAKSLIFPPLSIAWY